MTGTHSVYAPSSMGRIVQCHASPKMCEGIVQEETEDSREGDAVHFIGESMLKSMKVMTPRITSLDYVGKTAPNGVLITDEMYDAAFIYYRKVMDVAGMGHIHEGLNVERTIQIPRVHADCYGTPDADVWIPEALTLHIFDLKYGHRGVRAFENYQGIPYAVGRLDELTNGNVLHADSTVKVIIHIIQPRCYDGLGVERTWEVNAVDLRPYVNKMEHACAMASGPDPELNVGPECRDCPARHKCPAYQEATMVAVDYSRSPIPQNLSDAAIAHELFILSEALDLIKYRKDALELEALSRVNVPGWIIEQGMSNNQWLKPPTEIFTMCDILGVDVRDEPKPCTPTQAISRFKGAKVDPSVIEGFYGRKPTKKRLVPDDAKLAREIFSKEKL